MMSQAQRRQAYFAIARRTSPEARARRLLEEHLTDQQRATMREHGFFYLRMSAPGGRLPDGYVAALYNGYGIALIGDGGRPSLILHHFVIADVPVADKVLAQMMILQTDPATVLLQSCHWHPNTQPMPDALRLGRRFGEFRTTTRGQLRTIPRELHPYQSLRWMVDGYAETPARLADEQWALMHRRRTA